MSAILSSESEEGLVRMANFTYRVQWAQTAVQEEELEKKPVLCYVAIGPVNFLCVIFFL